MPAAPTRILTFRAGLDLVERVNKRASDVNQTVSTFLADLVDGALGGSGTPPRPQVVAPPRPLSRRRIKEEAASRDDKKIIEIDAFFLEDSTVHLGTPKICPRCDSEKITGSYSRGDGGTWSCINCQARGRWREGCPVIIDHVGLPRKNWGRL